MQPREGEIMQPGEGEGAVEARQEISVEDGIKEMTETIGFVEKSIREGLIELDEICKERGLSRMNPRDWEEVNRIEEEEVNIHTADIGDVWEAFINIPNNKKVDVIKGLLEKGDEEVKFVVWELDTYGYFDYDGEDEQFLEIFSKINDAIRESGLREEINKRA